jgi:hypothetical protein
LAQRSLELLAAITPNMLKEILHLAAQLPTANNLNIGQEEVCGSEKPVIQRSNV